MARRSNLSIARKLGDDINKKLARAVQESAVEIANGLANAGPAWTGEFSSAWDVVPAGQAGKAPRGGGRVYRYNKRNFPLSRFENSLKRGGNRFEVVNTAPHVGIAIDQDEALFSAIGSPVKEPVVRGFRRKDGFGEQDLGLRGDVAPGYTQEEPTASATASLDWFETYSGGGGLNRDLRRGTERAFVRGGSIG